jgi:5-methylcytosine-specific restriction endonuclease McrA
MSSERVPRRLRGQVGERARWRCEYCLSPAAFSTQPFEADHVMPRSKGGPTTLENLALSCGCNTYKGDRTRGRDPQTKRSVPLFNPRRQRWARHFAWSEDFLLIVGRTRRGRATIDTLHLNRPELINLRRVLRRFGKHPPRDE